MEEKMRVFQVLKDIYLALCELFKACWDAVLGIFTYTAHYRALKRRKEKADVHHHFKTEARKANMKWTTEERKKIRRLRTSKAIPKQLKDNYVVYNYLSSVLLTSGPRDSLQDVLYNFYSFLHPYLAIYYSCYVDMRKILAADDPADYLMRRREALEGKYKRENANLFSRAKAVMDAKDKVTKELRKQERDYRRYRRDEDAAVDLKMLEIEKQIIAEQEAKLKTEKEQLSNAVAKETRRLKAEERADRDYINRREGSQR